MDSIKFNLHSIVDVITNSSTVIYTIQKDTEVVKQLVAEVLELMGRTDLTPDDVFTYNTSVDDYYYVDRAYDEELPEDIYDEEGIINDHKLENYVEKFLSGEIEKPEWAKNIENSSEMSVYMSLTPKSEEFAKLGQRIISVLNSTDYEEGYG
jgi:hypothetical protein